jgi:D-arabinose 1-dehydrogenase-like Zn-dependent alcohol dehydrogenase
MRAIEVAYAGGPLQLVERETPQPGPGEVRIRIEACGVCHSDAVTVEGHFPGLAYPLTPGHEIAGVIDALGPEVEGWRVGQRVGVGWFGGQCGRCERCRRGDFFNCKASPITGVTRHGGYAEYTTAQASALASIPDELSAVDAAPMLCAGIATYNGLKRCGAQPGDLVAIQGVGGLGHLAVQFAVRMGFEVVGIDRGAEREALARRLGAGDYIDSAREDVAQALSARGGARAILATAPNSQAMGEAIDGLTADGVLLVLGVPEEPIPVIPRLLLSGRSVKGSAGGVAIEAEGAMAFSVQAGVRPMIETLPLEHAAEAYARMMAGEARFRMVLTMAG